MSAKPRTAPQPGSPVQQQRRPEPGDEPILEPELSAALGAAGYPTEIEVFLRLEAANMNPVLGHRMQVRPDGGSGGYRTAEIDLITSQLGFPQPASSSRRGTFRLRALIDVKRLHAPSWFAGYTGIERTVQDRRALRCRVGGLPAWDLFGARPGGDNPWIGESGIATALDALNQGVWCIHWAVVRRDKKLQTQNPRRWPARATHEAGFVDALDTLDRAATWAARDWTRFLETRDIEDSDPLPNIIFYCPTVLVETETLWYMNPASGELERSPWLHLERYSEQDGRVRRSVTDIVCVNHLDCWLEAQLEVSAALETWLSESGHNFELEALLRREQIRDGYEEPT